MHGGILSHMFRMLVAVSLAALATFSAAQAPQSPRSAVLATVNQFVDSFNKGDIETLLAACADQTSILDEFPPHEWHGIGACAKWVSDFAADAKKNGITDGFVTLGKSSHVDITADRAYVVIPANYTFKQRGNPVSEVGSIITLTLQKSPADWRITGWSWAKH
jgi:ketosteroid isomerase-like protein